MYDALNLDHATKVASLEELVTEAASRSDGAAFVLYSGKHAEEEARQVETLKDTAKTLNNLAAVLHELRRFDDAMRYDGTRQGMRNMLLLCFCHFLYIPSVINALYLITVADHRSTYFLYRWSQGVRARP